MVTEVVERKVSLQDELQKESHTPLEVRELLGQSGYTRTESSETPGKETFVHQGTTRSGIPELSWVVIRPHAGKPEETVAVKVTLERRLNSDIQPLFDRGCGVSFASQNSEGELRFSSVQPIKLEGDKVVLPYGQGLDEGKVGIIAAATTAELPASSETAQGRLARVKIGRSLGESLTNLLPIQLGSERRKGYFSEFVPNFSDEDAVESFFHPEPPTSVEDNSVSSHFVEAVVDEDRQRATAEAMDIIRTGIKEEDSEITRPPVDEKTEQATEVEKPKKSRLGKIFRRLGG